MPIEIGTIEALAFVEDGWLGGVITFGDGDATGIHVTVRDERCAMLNCDPDNATMATEVLRAAVRANRKNAGIYATVTRIGRLQVGNRVFLHR
jgi:hypothetical protein